METTKAAPQFGTREWDIYRYGILDAQRRKGLSEVPSRLLTDEDKTEMESLRSKLGMTHEEIVKADFAQMGVGDDIGSN